jgi:hypothetical protein
VFGFIDSGRSLQLIGEAGGAGGSVGGDGGGGGIGPQRQRRNRWLPPAAHVGVAPAGTTKPWHGPLGHGLWWRWSQNGVVLNAPGAVPPGVVTAAELVGELYASASAWKLSMSVICARAAALQSNPVPAHAWSHDWPLLPHRQCGASGAEGGGDGGGDGDGEHTSKLGSKLTPSFKGNTQISSSLPLHGVMRDDV